MKTTMLITGDMLVKGDIVVMPDTGERFKYLGRFAGGHAALRPLAGKDRRMVVAPCRSDLYVTVEVGS